MTWPAVVSILPFPVTTILLLFLLFFRIKGVRRRDTAWATLMRKTPFEDRIFGYTMLKDLPEAAARFLRYAIPQGVPLRPVSVVATSSSWPPRGQCHTILAAPNGWVFRSYGNGYSEEAGLCDAETFRGRWWAQILPLRRNDAANYLNSQMAMWVVLWSPTSLLNAEVSWEPLDPDRVRLTVPLGGRRWVINLFVSPEGKLDGLESADLGLQCFPGAAEEIEGLKLPRDVHFEYAARQETVRLHNLRRVPPYRGHSHS